MNTNTKPIVLIRIKMQAIAGDNTLEEMQGHFGELLNDYHVIVMYNTDNTEKQILTVQVFRDKDFTEVEHRDFLSKLNQILKDNIKQDGKETISY